MAFKMKRPGKMAKYKKSTINKYGRRSNPAMEMEEGSGLYYNSNMAPALKQLSPLHQEGPIDKKNPKLQKGEMEGTSVYKDEDINERMIDLEDRIEFLTSDIEGGSDRPGQNIEDMKKAREKLKQELAILMKRKR